MPANTVYVGRPSQWGNPYKLGDRGCIDEDEPSLTREDAVKMFQLYVLPELDLEPLKGKNLACWCPLSLPCHADILLETLSKKRTTK